MVPVRSVRLMDFHDACLRAPGWPHACNTALPSDSDVWRWVMENHRNNSLLWAEEDLARRTSVPDSEIANNKRNIDRYNQARNDATERVDEHLLMALELVDQASARTDSPVVSVKPGARLNSETAGSMIDRMSILALKIAAMRRQTERVDVDEQHRDACRAKLERLVEQRADLGGCLDALLDDAEGGRAYFKVYRQFKMYNDPKLNPVLVAERSATRAA